VASGLLRASFMTNKFSKKILAAAPITSLSWIPVLLLAASCGPGGGGGEGGGSGGSGGTGGGAGVSSRKVDDCKTSCKHQSFGGCYSAAELTACNEACGTSSDNEITVFVSCVVSSACNPQCRLKIPPAAAGTCQTACDKLSTCGFFSGPEKPQCADICATQPQAHIDCLSQNICSEVEKTCGTAMKATVTAVTKCVQACDGLLGDGCVPVADLTPCRARCYTSPATPRDNFAVCWRAARPFCMREYECYDAFKK
jgi:hypothetical protein